MGQAWDQNGAGKETKQENELLWAMEGWLAKVTARRGTFDRMFDEMFDGRLARQGHGTPWNIR